MVEVRATSLPVDIAGAYRIGIRDGHAAHAGSAYHLGRIGSYAAKADYQYVGLPQPVEFCPA